MSQAILNYTDVDYDKIIKQIEDRLKADGFESIIDSKLLMLCIDVFGASVDYIVYYLERRAEECFFDTARLRSSVILLSRHLGYSIQRPIPAQTSISITLKGNASLSGEVLTGLKIYFPRYSTKFNIQGKPYILKKSLRYTIGASDDFGNPDWKKTLSFATIEQDGTFELREEGSEGNYDNASISLVNVIQGEVREFKLLASENDLAGQIFQKYSIPDLEFSNLFGREDFSYDSETGDFELIAGLTQVSVTGPDEIAFSEETLYTIDRRSLVNHETLYRDTWDKYYDINGQFIEQNLPRRVVIKTDRSEAVELQFADGLISRMPKSTETIHIRYFATKGKQANQVGVIGTKATSNSKIYISASTLIDISSDIDYRLTRNINGGADIESIESIKVNAPAVYNALDRLISKGDYTSYLKGLQSPINISNAIVWGEQEEARARDVRAIHKYVNMIFYTVLGDLYLTTPDGRSLPKVLLETDTYEQSLETISINYSGLLEGFDYTIYSPMAYFNILVADQIVQMKKDERSIYEEFFLRSNPPYTDNQVGMVNSFPNGHPVSILNQKLESRGQLTVKHQYITPILQLFNIEGEVVLKDFADVQAVELRINNRIYSYLKEKINFNSPIYKSVVVDLIKSDKDVLYCNFNFKPVASNGTKITDWENEPEFSSQIPYQTSSMYASQTVDSEKIIDIELTSGFYDVGQNYNQDNYHDLVGKTVIISQNGGTTTNYAEISDASYKYAQIDYSIGNFLNAGDSIPAYNFIFAQPHETSGDWFYVRKRRKRVYDNTTGTWFYVDASTTFRCTNGDKIRRAGTSEYYEYDATNQQWNAISAPNTTLSLTIVSETLLDTEVQNVSVDIITNMEEVMEDLGFCPKGYLIEGFVNTIQNTIQQFFDIVACKKCTECPDEVVPLITPPENLELRCKPLDVQDDIVADAVVVSDCQNPSDVITWDEYYKATHPQQYKNWSRCQEIELLTQDEMYQGKFNSNLNIAKFESISLPKYPWRQNAPDKGEFDEAWVTETKSHYRIGGIHERWFYTVFMRDVIIELRRLANKKAGRVDNDFYTNDRQILDTFLQEFGADGSSFNIDNIKETIIDRLNSSAYVEDVTALKNVENFLQSNSFKGLMFKLHNGFTETIRSSMLDKEGNIVNYTLRNEIVQLRSNLVFRYRT